MSEVTNLRQAKNRVEVMGLLAEKDIHAGKNAANGKNTLEGYVTIKIDEINQIRIRVQADATKKDGDPNPAYENLEGFNANASSIAEVGLENASRVMSNSVQLNPYHSAQNNKDTLGYRTGFISVFRGSEEDYEPKAQANVELYVKGIFPEMDKDGEETGRAIIKGWMPTYSGIEPLDLVVPNDDGMAEEVLNGAIEVGQTFEFFADIVNNRTEIIKEIPTRLGKPRVEKSVSYTNELVMTGCSDPYEDNLAYDSNAIKVAIQEREDRIKNGGKKEVAQSKPSGSSMGRTANW